ncbi:MAG: hypothetical protein ACRC4T_26365 [Cetobacterium sp.]
MLIKKPYLEKKEKLYIKYPFQLKNNIEKELWFELDNEYEEYVSIENSDAALVSLLVLAMENGENIEIEGKVSEKLYYSLSNYIIPALNLANKKFKKIRIEAKILNSKKLYNSNNIGTGISCGIDSLSTVYTNIGKFRVNYFSFLNVGSHGDFGGEKARLIFNERYNLVTKYPTKNKIIKIDSNISDILRVNFQSTHTLRSIGAILNLQSLFKSYYYASAYRFENFHLENSNDIGTYDTLLLPLLSTETTIFYSSVSQYTRVERTDIVSNFKESYNHLNVCVAPLSEDGTVKNCSICFKCLRTELTLDLLGKLRLYKNVFSLEKYYEQKDKYIGYILYSYKFDLMSRDIYNLLIEKNFKINIKSIFYKNIYKYETFYKKSIVNRGIAKLSLILKNKLKIK